MSATKASSLAALVFLLYDHGMFSVHCEILFKQLDVINPVIAITLEDEVRNRRKCREQAYILDLGVFRLGS